MAVAHQRLNLDQEWPAALDAREHHAAAHAVGAFVQEPRARVRHFVQTRFAHLEHANLVGRTEPVLHRPEYAQRLFSFALEV